MLCVGNDGGKDYDAASLAHQYFESIPGFIDVVNMLLPQYDYSERVNVFITRCHSMGLLSDRLDWRNIYFDPKKTDPRFGGDSAAETFNTLVKEIRSEWKIKNIQAKVNARKKEAIERHDDYSKYVDSFFDDGCARLVVLQIGLGYKKQYANSINFLDITKDLNHLFRNKRYNSIFDTMKGYIAKLEYDVDKGIYCHILFFLDDSEGKNSSHIHPAEDIGEYWINTITKHRGNYWNDNDNANRHDALGRGGIWIINLSDTELRNNLKSPLSETCVKPISLSNLNWVPGWSFFAKDIPLKNPLKSVVGHTSWWKVRLRTINFAENECRRSLVIVSLKLYEKNWKD